MGVCRVGSGKSYSLYSWAALRGLVLNVHEWTNLLSIRLRRHGLHSCASELSVSSCQTALHTGSITDMRQTHGRMRGRTRSRTIRGFAEAVGIHTRAHGSDRCVNALGAVVRHWTLSRRMDLLTTSSMADSTIACCAGRLGDTDLPSWRA